MSAWRVDVQFAEEPEWFDNDRTAATNRETELRQQGKAVVAWEDDAEYDPTPLPAKPVTLTNRIRATITRGAVA